MLYKRNEFEEIIPKDDLRVGMKFCTREIIRYDWAQDTGLTFYHSHVIQRITPKRTKVVCEDGFEFNTREADFYKVVPELTQYPCFNTKDLVIDLGNCFTEMDKEHFRCDFVGNIGRLTVSVILNEFAKNGRRVRYI